MKNENRHTIKKQWQWFLFLSRPEMTHTHCNTYMTFKSYHNGFFFVVVVVFCLFVVVFFGGKIRPFTLRHFSLAILMWWTFGSHYAKDLSLAFSLILWLCSLLSRCFFCVQIHTSPHQSQPPTLVMPSKGSNPSEQVATSMWQQPLTGPLLPRAAIDWEPTWPPSVMHFHKPSCSCLWLKVLAFTLLQTVCRLFGLAWVTYR